MKFFTTAMAAAGALAAAGVVTAATASADAGDAAPATQPLGAQGTVNDGGVIQGWTVSNLRPSTDAIPHQTRGTLWEATATDVAIQGTATPMIPNLGARSASGQTYPALFMVATAQGVNPANLPQGQKTSGKVYFDVTGDAPNSAVYQAGGKDLLVWTPPAPPAGGRGYSGSASGGAHSSNSSTSAKPGPAGAEGTAADADTTPSAAGSQGTPLGSTSLGTPLAAEAGGTAATASDSELPTATGTAGSAEASTSASGPATGPQQTQGAPAQSESSAASGSLGTPLPAQAPGTTTTTGSEGTGPIPAANRTPAGSPDVPAANGVSNATGSH